MPDNIKDENIEIKLDIDPQAQLDSLGLEEKDVPKEVLETAHTESEPSKGYIDNKEEFERLHPGRTWISKEEYQRNAPLFENISSLKKTVKEQQKQMELLVNHTKQVREAALQAEMNKIANERQEAILQGDVERVNFHDRKLYEAVQKQAQTVNEQQQASLTPEAQAFHDRNKTWFNTSNPENTSMTQTALAVDQWVDSNKPHLSNSEKLQFVEDKIRELYPHRFNNPKKSVSNKVAPVSREESVGGSSTELRLSPDEFKVYKVYQKLGYTKAEFMKELKKTREVK